jgi:hypothetical protein
MQVNAGDLLRLKIQSRGEAGLPCTRGDDKLSIYLLHNVEDVIVYLDMQDLLDGTYTAIGRWVVGVVEGGGGARRSCAVCANLLVVITHF